MLSDAAGYPSPDLDSVLFGRCRPSRAVQPKGLVIQQRHIPSRLRQTLLSRAYPNLPCRALPPPPWPGHLIWPIRRPSRTHAWREG